MSDDAEPMIIAWSWDHPDNPWKREKSNLHRVVAPGADPCDCIHCQAEADTDEEETP